MPAVYGGDFGVCTIVMLRERPACRPTRGIETVLSSAYRGYVEFEDLADVGRDARQQGVGAPVGSDVADDDGVVGHGRGDPSPGYARPLWWREVTSHVIMITYKSHFAHPPSLPALFKTFALYLETLIKKTFRNGEKQGNK